MKGEEANYPSFMDIYLTIAGDVEALGRIIDYYGTDIKVALMKGIAHSDMLPEEFDIEEAEEEITLRLIKAIKKFEIWY